MRATRGAARSLLPALALCLVSAGPVRSLAAQATSTSNSTPTTTAKNSTVGQTIENARVLSQQATTLGALFNAVRTSARVAQFQDTLPREHERLMRQFDQLTRASLDSLSIDAVAQAWTAADGSRNAPLARIARYRTGDARAVLSTSEGIALDSLLMVTLQYLPDLLDARISEDSTDVLLAPINQFNRVRRTESLAQSLEKLSRYERKYGPASARLNVVEIGLNYVAQNIPPFAPSADGWPSPLELIASYVPSYFTQAEGRAQAWTLLEGGVRVYLFGERWGQPGLAGLLRPSHTSFGVALVSEESGALREPWRGNSRVGGFFSWGSAKLALVGGDGPNIFITQQVQLLPWVF